MLCESARLSVGYKERKFEYEQVFQLPQQGYLLQGDPHRAERDHTIESIEVIGGCNGNLKGISRLLKGMKAEDAIARMEGTTCGPRPTSCPDQIAQNLKRALAEL